MVEAAAFEMDGSQPSRDQRRRLALSHGRAAVSTHAISALGPRPGRASRRREPRSPSSRPGGAPPACRRPRRRRGASSIPDREQPGNLAPALAEPALAVARSPLTGRLHPGGDRFRLARRVAHGVAVSRTHGSRGRGAPPGCWRCGEHARGQLVKSGVFGRADELVEEQVAEPASAGSARDVNRVLADGRRGGALRVRRHARESEDRFGDEQRAGLPSQAPSSAARRGRVSKVAHPVLDPLAVDRNDRRDVLPDRRADPRCRLARHLGRRVSRRRREPAPRGGRGSARTRRDRVRNRRRSRASGA
jgi:hypothetical protein